MWCFIASVGIFALVVGTNWLLNCGRIAQRVPTIFLSCFLAFTIALASLLLMSVLPVDTANSKSGEFTTANEGKIQQTRPSDTSNPHPKVAQLVRYEMTVGDQTLLHLDRRLVSATRENSRETHSNQSIQHARQEIVKLREDLSDVKARMDQFDDDLSKVKARSESSANWAIGVLLTLVSILIVIFVAIIGFQISGRQATSPNQDANAEMLALLNYVLRDQIAPTPRIPGNEENLNDDHEAA